MREVGKVVRAKAYDFDELSNTEKALLVTAAMAREKAQAPYSKFKVGAAVISGRKTVHSGCNVERCSWTQTTHAEQNAIDSMVADQGPVKVTMVAIVAGPAKVSIELPPSKKKKIPNPFSFIEVPVPCGHCLQIIWENCFNDPYVKLMGLTSNGQVTITTIGDALPMRFGPADLGVNYQK